MRPREVEDQGQTRTEKRGACGAVNGSQGIKQGKDEKAAALPQGDRMAG